MSKILNTCTNYYSCQSYELDIVKIKQDVAYIRCIEISLLFPLDCITDGGSLSCRQLFIASLTFTSRSRAVSPFRRSIRVAAIPSLHKSFARNSETTPRALETQCAAV